MYTHTHGHTHTWLFFRVLLSSECMHADIRAYIHAYRHVCIHTYTHVRTDMSALCGGGLSTLSHLLRSAARNSESEGAAAQIFSASASGGCLKASDDGRWNML